MTVRLFSLLSRHWSAFDGWCASRNVDPMDLLPDRICSLIYFWAIRGASDQDDIDKFDRNLWRPPKGVEPPPGSPWSPERERAAVASFSAEVGNSVTRPSAPSR